MHSPFVFRSFQLPFCCSLHSRSPPCQVGFSGGLVVDYPHSTRAKKFFLVLMVGPSSYVPQAKGIDGAGGSRVQLLHAPRKPLVG